MSSDNSGSSRQEAAAAAAQILGCFATIQASDRQTFTAGFVALLARYQPWFIAIAADPVSGLAGSFKFCPSIAEAKEWLEKRFPIEVRHRELMSRPKLLKSPSRPRPVTGSATYTAQCERYGISAIPGGWDAVDLAVQHSRLGASFHEHVEKALRDQGDAPRGRGLFSAIVEKARAAREARLAVMTDDELLNHYGRKDTDAA